ncbi:hypothetical protein MMPV_008909 [Pyropia vietnamensis]
MAETTAAASALRAVLDPPPPPSDEHLAAAVGALSALRVLLDTRRAVSSRVSQLGAAVDAANRDTARRVEGVDGRVVEVKLASVLAMEERDRVAHELAALERQLTAVESGQAAGDGVGGRKKVRRRRWSTAGELPLKEDLATSALKSSTGGDAESDGELEVRLDEEAESTMRLLAHIEKELVAATEDVNSISAARTEWRRRQASESTSAQRA